ncbi:MAG: AAA family ATPase, partial [Anaerolineales bacterium]
MGDVLRLRLLGPVQVEREGMPVRGFESRKALALLCYLAMHDQPLTREHLADMFWGDKPEVRGRANLSRVLHNLSTLLPDCLGADRHTVECRHPATLWLDLDAFNDLAARGDAESLTSAVELVRGDFMQGFYLDDCPDFETWLVAQQEAWRQQVAQSLTALITHHTACGEYAQGLDFASRLLGLDPWREEAHRQKMLLLALSGQRSAALVQYETCRRVLAEELGVEPAEETKALYLRIRDGELDIATPELVMLAPPTTAQPPFLSTALPHSPPVVPFVARERELSLLDAFLDQTLTGRGQVVLITGGAGRGKTALIQAFAGQAMQAHSDLLVAIGNANAYTGLGDPYLPFREILGMLTGDVEARWGAGSISREQALRLWRAMPRSTQVLVDCGPELVDTFIPGTALVERAKTCAPGGAGWLKRLTQLTRRRSAEPGPTETLQSALFEQYTRVLQTLARQGPLLLAIDDLQWADAGSISLLFHLSRGLPGHRILILGAYRPEEVALAGDGASTGSAGPALSGPPVLARQAQASQAGAPRAQLGQTGRHPLEAVVNELKRSFGDIEVDLAQAQDREFVDAFLDTEANRLGPQFRETLYRQTRGHALFTIELLRGMQERRELVQDGGGRWIEGLTLDWERLPVRVEAVIAERFRRLPPQWQATLEIASVEGEVFTAEVAARVQAADQGEIIRFLSGELSKQHRLVVADSLHRLGGRRLSRYRFRHHLFQKYLYQSLDEVERSLLHEAVGNALESLYGEVVAEVPVRLARHFQAAGLLTKAADYLFLAGKRAARMSASQEAIAHFSRALDLTPADDLTRCYALTLAREKVYDLRGERQAQKKDLAALERLAEVLDEVQKRVEVTLRQARHAEATADYPAAVDAAQRVIRLSHQTGDTQGEATGYLMWGRALSRQGAYEAARCQLEGALARTSGARHLEAECLRGLGIVSQRQDDYAGARVYAERALGISREIGDRRGEAQALNILGITTRRQDDYAGAKTYWEQALGVFQEIGDRFGKDTALNNLGLICQIQDDYAGATAYYRQSQRICREIGD